MLMPVALTRLSAGLLFILARMFKEVGVFLIRSLMFTHYIPSEVLV